VVIAVPSIALTVTLLPSPPLPPTATETPAPTASVPLPRPPPPPIDWARMPTDSVRLVVIDAPLLVTVTVPASPPAPALPPNENQPIELPPLPPPPPRDWAAIPCEQPVPQTGSEPLAGPPLTGWPVMISAVLVTMTEPAAAFVLAPPPTASIEMVEPALPPLPLIDCATMAEASLPDEVRAPLLVTVTVPPAPPRLRSPEVEA
jgi:hypothetical protein